jgi:hypothetical protein
MLNVRMVSADCLETIHNITFIFYILIGLEPIDFWIISSKFKVTGVLTVRMVSADYLEPYS